MSNRRYIIQKVVLASSVYSALRNEKDGEILSVNVMDGKDVGSPSCEQIDGFKCNKHNKKQNGD